MLQKEQLLEPDNKWWLWKASLGAKSLPEIASMEAKLRVEHAVVERDCKGSKTCPRKALSREAVSGAWEQA